MGLWSGYCEEDCGAGSCHWCVVVWGCGVLGLYGGCLGEWLFSCKGRQLSLGFFRLGFFFVGDLERKVWENFFMTFLYFIFFGLLFYVR
jgi:hypothetical protein